jgi:glutamine amidotransferase
MCRFAIFIGDPVILAEFIIRPSHSIIYQSFGCTERSTPLNGDGFGIAWYRPDIQPTPGVFKSISPAWSNKNLLSLCEVTQSPCILAHVRAASPGSSVTEANCHPFCWKDLTFVHNGDIGCFKKIKKKIVHLLSEESFLLIEGSTDSEHIFALFIDKYRQFEGSENALSNALKETLQEIMTLVEPYSDKFECTLNIGITNGKEVLCSRYSTGKSCLSLYYSTKVYFGKKLSESIDIVSHGTIIASEPLGHDRNMWKEAPVNSIIHITEKRELLYHSIPTFQSTKSE